jgi:transcriptional regulator with XRE-family HTH domain
MILTSNLIRLRKLHKLSQQEISMFLGIKQSTYSDWESEKTFPSSRFIPKISENLQVTPNDLFGISPIFTIH